jgi:type I restriction enzyme R subunit
MVTSEVIISGPDDREGETDIDERNKSEVVEFWKKMMKRFGTERAYNRELINQFGSEEGFEVVIVVSKLLTGFDCPRNTIMYLTRPLKEHTLLQAIARVNRLHDGKEFGYIIDYRGVLKELDFALDLYGDLTEFDRADLEDILTDIGAEIEKLPQVYSDLWDIFKSVTNKNDVEAMQVHLSDEELRTKFYERFSVYARTLGIAMSSEKFLRDTDPKEIDRYRTDLKYFKNLRYAVGQRYAETVDFGEYQDKIAKLVNTYVGAGEVEQVMERVNIFESEKFREEVDKITEPAAKADTIAHRTLRTIHERWQEDPAFYEKFSKMLQDAIEAFRKGWLDAADYLKKVEGIMESVRNRTGDELPDELEGHEVAKAFYGVINRVIEKYSENGIDPVTVSAEAALVINEILEDLRITNWTTNTDRQNRMRTAMEDSLFDLKSRYEFDLSFEDIDKIMDDCIDVFKVRRP